MSDDFREETFEVNFQEYALSECPECGGALEEVTGLGDSTRTLEHGNRGACPVSSWKHSSRGWERQL